MRTVGVRYIVPVFCIVDIDAEPNEDGSYPDEAVVRVQQGDSSIVRIDSPEGIAALTAGDVIEQAYDGEPVDPSTLTPEERARALEVAEGTVWPVWEGY